MKIRIISIPPGFAPENIRRDWVGLEIPLATSEQLKTNPPSKYRFGSENIGGHVVLAEEGIRALQEAKRTISSTYWSGLLPTGSYLVFKNEVCELVE